MSPPPADVVIVGAGIIGCACAFELADAGLRVRVIDTRGVARGASRASAGLLAPYTEGQEDTSLRALGQRSLDRYDAFVARVKRASGHDFTYRRTATVEVAFTSDQVTQHQRALSALTKIGVPARWVDRDELLELEPLVSPEAHGALLVDSHGFVQVPQFTEALAHAAERLGVVFDVTERVNAITTHADGGVEVRTTTSRFSASTVVLAAGSWSSQVVVEGANTPLEVAPVRGQLLHLDWRGGGELRYPLWSHDCYLVPWPNGRLLLGATVEHVGYDERATVAGVRGLLDAGCALVPRLSQAAFHEVRVGLRPGSPDDLPVVGRSHAVPGLVYATGHYRNGVMLAPLTAELVRQLVLDRPSDPMLELMSPSRLGRL